MGLRGLSVLFSSGDDGTLNRPQDSSNICAHAWPGEFVHISVVCVMCKQVLIYNFLICRMASLVPIRDCCGWHTVAVWVFWRGCVLGDYGRMDNLWWRLL